MRECEKSEITVEKLMNIVHNYTDPIRMYEGWEKLRMLQEKEEQDD